MLVKQQDMLNENDFVMALTTTLNSIREWVCLSYFSKSSTAISMADTQKEFGKLKVQLHDLLYRLGDLIS